MQRLAEYEDLRDLYAKVIPEISKFEQRLIDFKTSTDNCEQIVRSLDELLISKVDKMYIAELKDKLKSTYASKNDHIDLANKFSENFKTFEQVLANV